MLPLEKSKPYFELAQSALTSLAIIVGGIWTYNEFVRERPDKGRLTVSHSANSYTVSPTQTFVQVRIELDNVGSSRVMIYDGVTRIQQVLPLTEKIARAIQGNDQDLTRRFNERQTLPWPVICSGHLSSMQRSIEPGEKLYLTQDFLVPHDVGLIRVYSYFTGDAQDDDQSGRWADGMLYKLENVAKENVNAVVSNASDPRLVCRNNE